VGTPGPHPRPLLRRRPGDRRRFEAIRCEVLRQPRDLAKLRDEVLAMRQRMADAHPNKTELFDLKHDRAA
jgi:glutamate-ammonia-ligase adenylyltransferase